jgi:hypothetical protein
MPATTPLNPSSSSIPAITGLNRPEPRPGNHAAQSVQLLDPGNHGAQTVRNLDPATTPLNPSSSSIPAITGLKPSGTSMPATRPLNSQFTIHKFF